VCRPRGGLQQTCGGILLRSGDRRSMTERNSIASAARNESFGDVQMTTICRRKRACMDQALPTMLVMSWLTLDASMAKR